MAVYHITYRTEAGARVSETFSAASCADALAAVAAKGGEPLSVMPVGYVRAVFAKGLLAGLVLAGVVMLACALLFETACTKVHCAETHAPLPERVRVSSEQPAKVAGSVAPVVERENVVEPYAAELKSATTNQAGYVTQIFNENGKLRRVIVKLSVASENDVDELIAWMMSAESEPEPPARVCAMVADEAFKQGLTNRISILERESPEIKKMKRCVLETRVELLGMLEAGHSLGDALLTLNGRICRDAGIRTEALIEVKRLYDGGELERMREFVDEMNAAFEQLGVKHLPMPGTIESPVVQLPSP